MKYVFAVKESGERITSYAVGIHGHNIEELQEKAATEYPQALVFQGDDDMQDEFLAGKWFAGGNFLFLKPSLNQNQKPLQTSRQNTSLVFKGLEMR